MRIDSLWRIKRFLKKDKRYVAHRLKQEFFFQLNKARYKFPSRLPLLPGPRGLNFFGRVRREELFHIQVLIDRANEVLNQRFDLLGSGPVILQPLRWSQDFKSGFEWGNKYCHGYAYNDLGMSNDVKVPWELSRLQFLPTLAQAHVLTSDSSYLEKIDWYLSDWERSNPFAYSINWACTMDVALRAISVLLTFELLKANNVATDLPRKYDRMLQLHGIFISENLEKSDINGNHYLADLVGLLFLGQYFQKSKWFDHAKSELEKEMSFQIYEEGEDFEGSVPYHRLVLELFYLANRLVSRNGSRFSSVFEIKLSRMFIFLSAYLKPNGHAPIIGDNDNGRAFILGTEDLNDHRYLLELGQISYPNLPLSYFEKSSDYSSWFGESLVQVPTPIASTYQSSNAYIFKDNRHYLFVEMSPIGLGGRGGHGHSDSGSFELIFNQIPLFVDTGSYAYTSDYKRRNLFRSTSSHNIIQIDDTELFPFIDEKNLWHLKNTIKERRIEGIKGGVRISHDGYGCDYRRSFEFVDDCFRLVDKLTGFEKKRKLNSRFHLHPDVEATLNSDQKVHLHYKDRVFEFSVTGDAKITFEPCEISFYFGQLQKSIVINFEYSLVDLNSCQLNYQVQEVQNLRK